MDFLQESLIGLLKAAEKFDPTKGAAFSTYSYFWMRQQMYRRMHEDFNTISIPVHKIEKAMSAYMHGRTETLEGVPLVTYLEEDMDIEDKQEETRKDRYEDDEYLDLILSKLDPRDRDILYKRFGFSGEERTLQELGNDMGITRERIRQLQNRALRHCRIIVSGIDNHTIQVKGGSNGKVEVQ
jgi:RNA polymerase primary sigma factor